MADIIPLILSETVALKIPEEFLERLAACSTYVVKEKVKRYLSTAGINVQARELIKRVYSEQIELEDFLASEELKDRVELIKELEYVDVTPNRSIQELDDMKEAIEYILNNKNAIPYIAPIKGDLIVSLRDDLIKYGKEANCKEAAAFGKVLKSYSTYFRDSQHESYKGTVVKKIIRNRSKYEIILHGLGFMLDKKRRGISPSAWGYL